MTNPILYFYRTTVHRNIKTNFFSQTKDFIFAPLLVDKFD